MRYGQRKTLCACRKSILVETQGTRNVCKGRSDRYADFQIKTIDIKDRYVKVESLNSFLEGDRLTMTKELSRVT